MSVTMKISIAKQFSEAPAGRHAKDGPYSGERFREEFLAPALEQNEVVEIDLDGALGYGSSFLEEAFGGLVRVRGLRADELHRRLHFRSTLALYPERIWSYIEDADRQRH